MLVDVGVFIRGQHIGAVEFRGHFAEFDGSIMDQIAHVEVASVDVAVTTVLNWVLCHLNSGGAVHVDDGWPEGGESEVCQFPASVLSLPSDSVEGHELRFC